jgi:uncharacterized protein (TIGR02284 family)
MATFTGKERSAIELLKHLIELDYDAVEAYKVAVEKISEAVSQEALRAFQRDHERHIDDLGAIVTRLGEQAPDKGDAKRLLTQGKVHLGALMGDKAILQAMKTNEDDTNTAYERANARTDLPAGAADVIRRGLADERRHRAWIVNRIDEMNSAGDGTTPVTQPA